MSEHRLADLATKLLRRHNLGSHDASSHYAERANVVAVIERALAARTRRRRTRLFGAIGVAAAAIIAVFAPRLLSLSTEEGSPRLIEAGGSSLVQVGDRLLPKAPATLTVNGGTLVAIAAASEVDVLELGGRQRFGLDLGRIRATVDKRRSGEEFSILTPDALVSVRGTEFEVEVVANPTCSAGRATRVEVFAGEVAVRHDGTERRLFPSHTWLSPCALAPPPAVPSMPRPSPPAGSNRVVSNTRSLKAPPALRPSASAAQSAAAIQSSDLTEQNELFGQALAARRRGDLPTALAHLDELLTRFPRSPLAEAATRARQDLRKSTP